MLIEYYLADGQQITWETGSSIVDMHDVDGLTMMYAQKRPNDLPTDVYMHVSIYSNFVKGITPTSGIVPLDSGPHIILVYTGCGPLRVHPMPWAFDGFKVLVGKQEDFDRYNIDKIFEDVVLRDCERE